MNMIINRENAIKAANIHAHRCCLFGQSYQHEAWEDRATITLAEQNSLEARGRKFDSLGLLFYRVAEKLNGKGTNE